MTTVAGDSPQPDSRPPTLRHRRLVIGVNVLVQVLAVLALVVMADWLASRHYLRFDWTQSGYYKLSDKTKQLIGSLKEPIDVVVFLPESGRQEYVQKVLDDVRNLLKEFQYYGKGKLRVEYVDPERDLLRAQQLVRQYNLDSPDVVIFANGVRHKYIRLDEMVDLDRGPEMQDEPRIKAFKAEGLFLAAIQTVTEEAPPKVYFLTGHGERDPENFDQANGYSEIARYIKQDNITVDKWNLQEKQALPTDAGAIVIAGPRKPFSQMELEALDRHLKNKGRLFILLDPQTQTGLEALLRRWGVQVDEDLAISKAGVLLGTELINVTAVGTDYAPHPITARLADTNTEFPYTRSVRRLPQSAETGTGGQPLVTELVKTGAGYWGETNPEAEHASFNPATDIAGPLPLAVAVESSKPQGVNVDIGVTRLVVTGTSRFVDNNNGDLSGGNLDFFMNSLNWLLQREQLVAVGPKTPQEFRLDMSPNQQTAVYVLVMGAMPLAVAVVGLMVWLGRRK
ncbi:MAG TPA: GldG family protein [Verrucomicrobiae bacterium]|nr:GldG family protein [Verrucomicrobiae bacterium]